MQVHLCPYRARRRPCGSRARLAGAVRLARPQHLGPAHVGVRRWAAHAAAAPGVAAAGVGVRPCRRQLAGPGWWLCGKLRRQARCRSGHAKPHSHAIGQTRLSLASSPTSKLRASHGAGTSATEACSLPPHITHRGGCTLDTSPPQVRLDGSRHSIEDPTGRWTHRSSKRMGCSINVLMLAHATCYLQDVEVEGRLQHVRHTEQCSGGVGWRRFGPVRHRHHPWHTLLAAGALPRLQRNWVLSESRYMSLHEPQGGHPSRRKWLFMRASPIRHRCSDAMLRYERCIAPWALRACGTSSQRSRCSSTHVLATSPAAGQGANSAQVAAVIGFGAVSSVGCQGSTLAVEREWVKALCAGDSAMLARRNAGANVMSSARRCLSPCCRCWVLQWKRNPCRLDLLQCVLDIHCTVLLALLHYGRLLTMSR